MMARTYAQALRRAWLQKVTPAKEKVPDISIKQFTGDIALSPADLTARVEPSQADSSLPQRSGTGSARATDGDGLRPNAGGATTTRAVFSRPTGASSSSGPPHIPGTTSANLVPAEGPIPADAHNDYWVETENSWICVHVIPRHNYFSPYDLRNGPDPETLGPIRTTQMVVPSTLPNQPGTLNTEHHNWRDKHNTKTRTRHRWTGKSIFQKMNAEQPNEDDALPNAVPIRPDSTEGVRASLAGMRTQLAAAQRRDPRLQAIIRALKGEPRGNYVSDSPVADGRRLKTRLYKYRLASDGVIVARPANDDPSVDRPVVPDATYELY